MEGFREFYRSVLKLPAAGGSFFHSILQNELDEQADRLSDSQLEALFEVGCCLSTNFASELI